MLLNRDTRLTQDDTGAWRGRRLTIVVGVLGSVHVGAGHPVWDKRGRGRPVVGIHVGVVVIGHPMERRVGFVLGGGNTWGDLRV